jgi:hypothetical protein
MQRRHLPRLAGRRLEAIDKGTIATVPEHPSSSIDMHISQNAHPAKTIAMCRPRVWVSQATIPYHGTLDWPHFDRSAGRDVFTRRITCHKWSRTRSWRSRIPRTGTRNTASIRAERVNGESEKAIAVDTILAVHYSDSLPQQKVQRTSNDLVPRSLYIKYQETAFHSGLRDVEAFLSSDTATIAAKSPEGNTKSSW